MSIVVLVVSIGLRIEHERRPYGLQGLLDCKYFSAESFSFFQDTTKQFPYAFLARPQEIRFWIGPKNLEMTDVEFEPADLDR